MDYSLSSKKSLRGDITIPPDKSLSHRAVMFNSLADGNAKISNFLMGEDCLSTISVLRELGVKIEVSSDSVITHGKGRMWGHGSQISIEDRWKIVKYVQTLQKQ